MAEQRLAEFESWHRKWCYTRTGGALHRVVYGRWDDHEWRFLDGEAACGLKREFFIPGLFSRMGHPRCKFCCRRVGIPAGVGAPFNNSDKNLTKEQQEA